MLVPLFSKEEMARSFTVDEVSREAWRSLIRGLLDNVIERYMKDDLVRGVVFTDAKIGVFTYSHDPSLVQNRCFLYHLIGNKTGEWKVPVGGMGAVSSELERVARRSGAELLTNVDVQVLSVTGNTRSVEFRADGRRETAEAQFLLINFWRSVLAKYTGRL